MELKDIIKELESTRDEKNIAGLARFGIRPGRVYGTKVPVMRAIGKKAGKDHALARKLWNHGYRETRIIASIVAEPDKVTQKDLDAWLSAFDYWEIVDQFCMNLFIHLPDAKERAIEWSRREREFERRAGYALMACFAWKKKDLSDEDVEDFYPELIAGAPDGRNDVKKSISWALRQIGKKRMSLNKRAVEVALEIEKQDAKGSRWVAKDVLKELTDEKTLGRIRDKEKKDLLK